MTREEFIQKFALQFDDTDITCFRADTQFRTLDEWDSLKALSIIAMIDEEFGVIIKGDEMKSCQTLEDVFALTSSKL